MSVSLQHICAAVQHSLALRFLDEQAEQDQLDAKRATQAEQESAWQAELVRREVKALDEDGSREAARMALQERQEQERLDFIADAIMRQQAKLS